MKRIVKRIQEAITNPKGELTRWEKFIVYLWLLSKEGASQLADQRANMMAASLTYRTLFGLLPVTVVGAGVARSIMGGERFEQFLHTLVNASGLNDVTIDTTTNQSMSLGGWIADVISSGLDINVAALTWVSVLVLVYSSIALMSTIEHCFNRIFNAKDARSWLKRIPLYWFILTFGPILLAVAFWADGKVDHMFTSILPSNWLGWTVSSLWSLTVVWISMFTLYTLVPVVKVERNSAWIGALVATLLLTLGKGGLSLYFSHALSLKQLYGSLGLVPVFMFWLYLMWLITLLGLQVTSIVQNVSLERKNRDFI